MIRFSCKSPIQIISVRISQRQDTNINNNGIYFMIVILNIILDMSKAFKKKKTDSHLPQSQLKTVDFLIGSQRTQPSSENSVVLERSLILKSAMFWDTKARVERIKSLVLSNLNISQFEDVHDFKIAELTSIELLSLSKNRIIHLQPISVLDTLLTLNINHNQVYDLSPLAPLTKLSQLYASNNQISIIDSLAGLLNLKVVNLYQNKIASLESVYTTLEKLTKLQDLDIEHNPFWTEDNRKDFIQLPITRLNGQLISKAEKQTQNATNSDVLSMSSSCILNPLNLSMTMNNTQRSFFHKNSSGSKRSRLKQLKEQLQRLQEEYISIDDQFEEQIVRNVQLKSDYHNTLVKVRQCQSLKEDNEYKAQQIKLLKRKVKDIKQNLFTKNRKGQLLRTMFQLETHTIQKKAQTKSPETKTVWSRRFDCDDVIVIEDDSRYLEEDRELAALLQNNSNSLEQLRRELQSLY